MFAPVHNQPQQKTLFKLSNMTARSQSYSQSVKFCQWFLHNASAATEWSLTGVSRFGVEGRGKGRSADVTGDWWTVDRFRGVCPDLWCAADCGHRSCATHWSICCVCPSNGWGTAVVGVNEGTVGRIPSATELLLRSHDGPCVSLQRYTVCQQRALRSGYCASMHCKKFKVDNLQRLHSVYKTVEVSTGG